MTKTMPKTTQEHVQENLMYQEHTQNVSFFSSPITIKRTAKKHFLLSKHLLFMQYRKNIRYCFLSTACSHIQGRNRFPRMNKVLPPPMHGRYFYSYLTSIRNCLGGNHSYTTPYPFDVLLSVWFWQYQIPYPERQIIVQLCAQKIYPVCKKLPHRKVTEKLICKPANPFLALPTLHLNLHNLWDIALMIGYYHIVKKDTHKITVNKKGYKKSRQKVELEEGEKKEIELVMRKKKQ